MQALQPPINAIIIPLGENPISEAFFMSYRANAINTTLATIPRYSVRRNDFHDLQ